MGTEFPKGDKPSNRITISRGVDASQHVIKPDGTVDRSFAQPNPALPPREVPAKAHASEQDELDAITKNSKKGVDHKRDGKSGQDAE